MTALQLNWINGRRRQLLSPLPFFAHFQTALKAAHLTNHAPMALFLSPYLAQHGLSLGVVDVASLGLVAGNIFVFLALKLAQCCFGTKLPAQPTLQAHLQSSLFFWRFCAQLCQLLLPFLSVTGFGFGHFYQHGSPRGISLIACQVTIGTYSFHLALPVLFECSNEFAFWCICQRHISITTRCGLILCSLLFLFSICAHGITCSFA